MDDQPHRRRRVRSTPPADRQPSEDIPAPQKPASQKDSRQGKTQQPARTGSPSQEAADTASPVHRRRKTAPPPSSDAAQGEIFWHPESALLDQKKTPPPKPEKKRGTLPRLISAVDAAVCRVGDCLIYTFKWLIVSGMFLLGFAAKGLKKLGSFLLRLRTTNTTRSAVHTGKRIQKKAPEAPQSVTIQPTRPEDYHGLGEKRASGGKRRVIRAPGRKFSLAYSAAIALLMCIALVSTVMIGSILLRTIRTKSLNDSLSERYSQIAQPQQDDSQDDSNEETPSYAAAPDDADEDDAFIEPAQQADSAAPESTPKPSNTPEPLVADAVKSTKFHQVGGDALPEMAALHQENRDLIGWLRMEGILDLPVVYKDNEYYLKRDFYKNKSAAGTIFLDENHPFRENAQNLLLHGHNMKDGTMFGRLVQYETNLQFLKNNPFIQYSTLWKKEQYVIFAVLHVSLDVHSEDFFNYFTHHTFSSDTQFDNYVRSLQNRSVFSIPIDVQPTDALLTLSTCLDEDRLVIVARRLRDGESKSEVRHLVQLAARQ